MVIFTIHTCNYIEEHFRLVPFHTCHGDARLDWASDSPADGGNATLLDANRLKTQQKKKKMELGWIYEYVAEDISYYSQEHGGLGAVFVWVF